jgi:hypothetical protein
MPTHKTRQQTPKTMRDFGTDNLFRLPPAWGIRMSCSFLAITGYSLVPFLKPLTRVSETPENPLPSDPQSLSCFSVAKCLPLLMTRADDFSFRAVTYTCRIGSEIPCVNLSPGVGIFLPPLGRSLHTPNRDGISRKRCFRSQFAAKIAWEIGETVYENFAGKCYGGKDNALMAQMKVKIK